MKYLHSLSKAGLYPEFVTGQFRYGKIPIYCIIGPEKHIIHLTFTAAKHDQARELLAGLANSTIRPIPQQSFPYNNVFNDYFTGNLTSLPFKAESPFLEGGTPFQQSVWRQIAAIPYGRTISYQELAERVGSPNGARAAGTACGKNPLALIIPCHRVTARTGLGGFAGGTAVKKILLTLESLGKQL